MKYLGTRSEQYDPVVTQDISGKQDKATLSFAGSNGATAGYANAAYNGGVRPYFYIKGH